jgi:hypothetical protein
MISYFWDEPEYVESVEELKAIYREKHKSTGKYRYSIRGDGEIVEIDSIIYETEKKIVII